MKFIKLHNFSSYKKKLIISIIFLVLALLSIFCVATNAYAEDDSVAVTEELTNNVQTIIEGIDFSEFEELISGLDDLSIFDGGVKEKVVQILNGEYFNNYSSLISALLSLLLADIREFLPFLFTLIAIGILSNLLNEFRGKDDSVSDIVHFACFGVMIISVLFVFKDILSVTSSTMSFILKQMQVVFPILVTMLTSIGSFSTVSIYNPLVAVLTTVVSVVFEKFLYPIFIVMFLFSVVSNLSSTVKLEKLQGFLGSAFKWIVGMVFTLFTGFLSIQGISAGKFDSVSIKATKFAVKSYIPIIGSYLSDGMDFLVLGSVLVKNTIGLIGVLILFLSIVSPIISILIIKLGLQLSSGVLEMTGNSKMSNFLSSCSKMLIYPIVLILGVSFMYVITIALIMCTANIF